MRHSACISAAAVLSASLMLFTTDAHAQDPGGTPSQPPPAPPPAAPVTAAPADPNAGLPPVKPRERGGDDDEEDELKHFSLSINPLSLILTRIGINFEYMLAKHHGLIVNPFFQSFSVGDTSKTSYSNFGGELGYRFYTGSRGANGFFVGPFITAISSSIEATSTASAGGVTRSATATESTFIYGGGVDLGGQHVFRSGFTIGAGGGITYLKASSTVSGAQSSSTFKIDGVLPRILFQIGWSF